MTADQRATTSDMVGK